MTVKRYTPTQCCEHDGTYVTYSDYQRLAVENAALKDINAWCRTEAFQNMYREFKIAEAAGCDTVDCMHDAMLTAIMHAPATPATDDAIAEIKAQGVDVAISHIRREQARSEMISDAISEAFSGVAEDLVDFAANLRAGRKE